MSVVGTSQLFQLAQQFSTRLGLGTSEVGVTRDESRVEQTTMIYSLPGDVLLLIFAFLGTDDLLTCMQVCHLLRYVLQHDVRLQYQMELDITGMVDGPPSDVALSDRLEKLREYRIRSHSVPLVCASKSWPKINLPVQVIVSEGTILYASRGSDHTAIEVAAPDPTSSTSPQTATLDIRGESCNIVAVDVSQDLFLAWGGIPGDSQVLNVHLLSLATGKAHPAATQSIIQTPPSSLQLSLVRIYRRYFIWQTCPLGTSSRLVQIWDWQAGCLIWQHTFRPQVSYTFLDEYHVIVTSSRQEELEIYRFRDKNQSQSEELPRLTVDPILILELPLGAFRCSLFHDDRSRIHTSSSPAPFMPDPSLALIPVHFKIYALDLSSATLLVPGATFLNEVARVTDPLSTLQLFWHEWGPEGALLLNMSSPGIVPRTFFAPHGTRFPMLVQDKWGRDSAHVVIIDTNPWAVRRSVSGRRQGLEPYGSLDSFRFRKLRGTIPHVAYLGPRVSFPKGHKPTIVTMNPMGFTVTHERDPPYREKQGFGHYTFYPKVADS